MKASIQELLQEATAEHEALEIALRSIADVLGFCVMSEKEHAALRNSANKYQEFCTLLDDDPKNLAIVFPESVAYPPNDPRLAIKNLKDMRLRLLVNWENRFRNHSVLVCKLVAVKDMEGEE